MSKIQCYICGHKGRIKIDQRSLHFICNECEEIPLVIRYEFKDFGRTPTKKEINKAKKEHGL